MSNEDKAIQLAILFQLNKLKQQQNDLRILIGSEGNLQPKQSTK